MNWRKSSRPRLTNDGNGPIEAASARSRWTPLARSMDRFDADVRWGGYV